MQSFLTILPMAIVMVAGPQIISAVLLATSLEARRNSLAYISGVAIATALGLTVWYTLSKVLDLARSAAEQDSGKNALD